MIDTTADWIQISQRQRMSPFPNYISMESVSRDMRSVIGEAYREVVVLLQQRHMYVYMQRLDHERVGQRIMEKVLAQPDIFMRLLRRQKEFERSMYRWLHQHNTKTALTATRDAGLAALHREFDRRYRQIYSHYFPILSIERYFFEYLRDYIASKESDSRRASKYVDTLITERRAMVNRQERYAALRLAIVISQRKKWRDYFRGRRLDETIARIRGDHPLHRLVQRHLHDFFWITRDYEDPILTYTDIVKRLQQHVRGNPAAALHRMHTEDDTLKRNIQRIIRRLGIDQQHQRLFQTMREGIYYKEYRKQIVSKSLYYYDPILQEIARRSYLSMLQARHLKTSEIARALTTGDMAHELNARIAQSAWYVRNGTARVCTGAQAQPYFDFFVKVNPHTRRFVGMPVSPGQATGPVKIVIHPSDFQKVKKGDVIATIQATPVFTRVLSISSALICDGGPGITSHPATLAREAGIPGIIGLATTTKVLKDGVRVSVDGDTGIVQVLK